VYLATASFIWESDKTGVAMKTVSYCFNILIDNKLIIKPSADFPQRAANIEIIIGITKTSA
jgi:hypothetical protein